MTQYPSPYSPPDVYVPAYAWDPYRDLLAPARRASTLMLILGAIGLLCGLCGLGLTLVPWDQMPPHQVQPLHDLESQVGAPLKTIMLVFGVAMSLPSVLLGVFGILVRRGGKGIVITSIVLIGLLVLGLLFTVLGGLIRATGRPQQAVRVFADVCVWAIVLALMVLLLVWLIQALKATGQIRAAQQQYQQQYWQYLQQQQMYAQSGYGSPAAPPGSAEQEGQPPIPSPPP